MSAFVVQGDSLVSLPRPNVAAPDFDGLGDPVSALPYVTAFRTTDGFELEFDSHLVLDPGGREETVLCRSESRIILALHGDVWQLHGASELPASASKCP